MGNTALPEDLGSMEGRCYDAKQLRWAVMGVEDARIPRLCGNEHASIEAAKRDPKRGWNLENGLRILQHYIFYPREPMYSSDVLAKAMRT